MKVVLLQNVKKLGQKDAVVEVADGFALNSLIPSGKAAQATPSMLEALAARVGIKAKEIVNKNAHIRAAIESLRGRDVVLRVRANERGALFQKITVDDVVELLKKETSAPLVARMVVGFDAPIKQIGTYDLKLESEDMSAPLRLVVTALE